MDKVFIALTFLLSSLALFSIPFAQQEFNTVIFTDFSFLFVYLIIGSIVLPAILGFILKKYYVEISFIKILRTVFFLLNFFTSLIYLFWLLSGIHPGF
jgi:hypothetical protein